MANKMNESNKTEGETIIHGVKAKLTFDEQVVKKLQELLYLRFLVF